ncbi:transmembrane emp24 domain-containing protein p24delta3-like [Cicer arietinum]|uniref:Transmembrane emp24 domain-containing protein p24delta3-like n=1 Tax=Cicer arietinum TaxID=3827 RepID=A0A1S2XJM1_CICAR|nr:transmembrane emp24 domain-containing protein p24delta3-like [Cicer arietinum]
MNFRDGNGIIFLFLLTTLSQVFLKAEAVWLRIPSSDTKCVSEKIQTNVVVLGTYFIVRYEGPQPYTISANLTSPSGNNLHQNENATNGKFAFTTEESGIYVACFWMCTKQEEVGRIVSLDWKTGISTKDWDSVAKKEKIQRVELEIMKLEELVGGIQSYLIYFKDKEAKMREDSERTHARVSWFNIMSLGLCVLVSALQLWYMEHFFRKKKLI